MVSTLISSVKGTLEGAGPGWVNVAVGGVTFRIHVPVSTAEHLGQPGNHVRLYTSLQVREESLTLYGFQSEEARLAFETLLGVNGIGPRVALSVLSRLTPEALAAAVSTEDANAFSGIPGVGKKTASRIVLELKGKLGGVLTLAPAGAGDGEAVEALTSLGYTVAEAREAVASIQPDSSLTLEDKVRLALQHMASQ